MEVTMTNPNLRIRKSVRVLEQEHFLALKNKDKKSTELQTLILAFRAICDLDADKFESFFVVAGYHGEPFRGAGWSNNMWWGGYCYHGQILFPTWHRAYCLRLENALRSVPGCENVALPFLDWCDEATRNEGLPITFTLQQFPLLSGEKIDNPLYSYKFKKGVFDNIPQDAQYSYTKQAGYQTVRYPLSGLVGDAQIKATEKHNAQYPYEKAIPLLQQNIKDWLNHKDIVLSDGTKITTGVYEKFQKCLLAPNYTVFSNTSSARQYNQELLNKENPTWTDAGAIMSLESPHNSMHLAVGGFQIPGQGNDNQVDGANGDMGENDTASFDPIFFFHHCFVDRMFWLWQKLHKQTKKLVIHEGFEHYPGTNNMDSQGPTPGMPAGVWIDLETPLHPFTKDNDGKRVLTSNDVVDIEEQLGYTYGPGSFADRDGHPSKKHGFMHVPPDQQIPKSALAIKAPSRGTVRGSYLITTWAKYDNGGQKQLIDVEAILNRNHTQGCANCQAHLNVNTFAPLYGLTDKQSVEDAEIEVLVHTHENPGGESLSKELLHPIVLGE